MDEAGSLRSASRKRKNLDSSGTDEVEKKYRKLIKKEVEADCNEVVDEVNENEDAAEVVLVKEKKSKKKKKDRESLKVKLEILDEPEAIETAEVGEQNDNEGENLDVVEVEDEKVENGEDEKNTDVKKLIVKVPSAVKMISFDECERMHNENASCGMVIIQEKRHFALSYHLLGGNIMKSIEYILNQSIGKYRSVLKGVVIAVKGAKLLGHPRVIDDHTVFHCYTNITQAIFQPVLHQNYECVVKHISNDYISALILSAISITMPRDKNFHENLRGIPLEMGDTIMAKYTAISINRGLCSLKGNFIKIVKKGVKPEAQQDDKSAVKLNTTTRFVDSDNDSE